MAQYQQYQQPGQQQAPQAPRRPRTNPYNDGVSSSAQHYDLFEMIRRPNARQDNRPPDPPPKPLHSKQKQIELEVEKKFQEKKSVATETLARLIKFFVFILILPPYILLYRLPKFLLIDWVVALATYIDNKLRALGTAIQRRHERLKLKIKMAFVNFWNLLKSTFRKRMAANPKDDDEPLSFLAFIAEGIIGLYRLTLHPIFRAAKTGWHLTKVGYRALRESPMKLHLAVQDTMKRLARLRDQLIDWVKNRLYLFKEAIANRTIRPVSRWIDAKVEAVAAIFRKGIEKLKKIGTSILFAFRHPIQTGRTFRNASRTSYNRFIATCRSWTANKKQAIYSFWIQQKSWFDKTIRLPVRTQWKKIQAFGEKWVTKVAAPFKNIYKSVQPYVAALRTRLATFAQGRTERPRHWLRQKTAPIKAAYALIKETWNAIYDQLEAKVTKRLEKMKRTARAFAEPFVWAGKHLWETVKPALQPVLRMYHRLEARMNALGYRLRRIIAWAHVLTRYGMELVRGTTESLFGTK